MNNWIPDVNRFTLAEPPKFFLSALWDFDASLVIIPSKQEAVYRLAQRRKLQLPAHVANDPLFNMSDTQMMANHGLVPVTTIMPTINWADPANFFELARRAPWRQGGAEKVIKAIEEQEAKDDINKAVQQDDMLSYLGKDAWGLYNKKIGLRTSMYVPRNKSALVRSAKAPSLRFK